MKKALVVEDHPDMRNVLTFEMEMMGFSVIAAKDGKEGVEKAFEEKSQLILTVIVVPGMDAREATRLIRANPETQDIPILAATGLFLESDRISCLKADCNITSPSPSPLRNFRENSRIMFLTHRSVRQSK